MMLLQQRDVANIPCFVGLFSIVGLFSKRDPQQRNIANLCFMNVVIHSKRCCQYILLCGSLFHCGSLFRKRPATKGCCQHLLLCGSLFQCGSLFKKRPVMDLFSKRDPHVVVDVVYCSVLQCVAVCCGVLQCVAVCCIAWQCQFKKRPARTSNPPVVAVVCCGVLRCVVV